MIPNIQMNILDVPVHVPLGDEPFSALSAGMIQGLDVGVQSVPFQVRRRGEGAVAVRAGMDLAVRVTVELGQLLNRDSQFLCLGVELHAPEVHPHVSLAVEHVAAMVADLVTGGEALHMFKQSIILYYRHR